eukprot:3939782-Rhodomonas_salina.3
MEVPVTPGSLTSIPKSGARSAHAIALRYLPTRARAHVRRSTGMVYDAAYARARCPMSGTDGAYVTLYRVMTSTDVERMVLPVCTDVERVVLPVWIVGCYARSISPRSSKRDGSILAILLCTRYEMRGVSSAYALRQSGSVVRGLGRGCDANRPDLYLHDRHRLEAKYKSTQKPAGLGPEAQSLQRCF